MPGAVSSNTLPVDPIQQLTDISCPNESICTTVGKDAKDNAAFFGTSNGGATWVPESVSPGTPFAFTVSCPTISFCLAMGVKGVHPIMPVFVQTTDGGSQWTTNPPPDNLGNSVFYGATCSGPTACYVIQNNHVYGSTDVGVTWTSLTQAGMQIIRLVACVRAAGCLVIGTDSQGAPLFGRILPSGTSVVRVAGLPHPKGFAFTSAELSCPSLASCTIASWKSTRILTTSDGGVRWTVRSLPASATIAGPFSCPDAKVCVIPAVSSRHSGILLALTTTNGGASWSLSGIASARTPNSNLGVSGISCPSASVCFVSDPALRQNSVFVRRGFTSHWVQKLVK